MSSSLSASYARARSFMLLSIVAALLVFSALPLTVPPVHAATGALAIWSLVGANANTAPTAAPTSTTTGVTAGNLTASGLGTPLNFDGSLAFSGWSDSAAADPAKYMQWSVTPQAGYSLTYTSISFYLASNFNNPQGPRTWNLRASTDGFTTSDIDLATIAMLGGGMLVSDQDISGVGTQAGTVTFRLYGYGVGNTSFGGLYTPIGSGIPGLAVNGSVSGPPAFTSGAPASGKVGDSYSHTFTTSDSSTTFSLVSGSLPPGLSLDSTTGELAGTPSQAGSYNFTIQASNSSGSAQQIVNLTISKADQTISFATLSDRTYGDASFTVSAGASSGLAVSFSSQTSGVCTVSGTTITILAAGACTIAADQAGDTNYTSAPQVTRTFSVAKKALTVSADPQHRIYGALNPLLTFTTSGLVNGDTTATALTGSLATTASASSPVGSYDITQGTLDAVNYTITFVNGTLTISSADQKLYLPLVIR